jgi:hypothetical protein
MDDVAINEFSSVEHWEPPFKIIITRLGVHVRDRTGFTVAQLIAPTRYTLEDRARLGHTVATMLELRHANWEASL